VKIFTTACILASFLLCLVMVRLFGQVELPHQPRATRLKVLQEMEETTFIMMMCLIGAGTGSIIVVRRAKAMYREEALRNMEMLVEETRKARG
jgi:hypothetical protein